MTQITIKSNVGLVRQGLQDLGAEIPKIGRRKMYDAVNRITREMEGYPPERQGQKYVRTGRLGFSWRVHRLDTGYVISNNASRRGRYYTRYVVGDAYGHGQAWMHVGRWQKFKTVVDAEIEKMPQQIVNEIEISGRRLLPQ